MSDSVPGPAIVLLSGGMDSAVVLAMAGARGHLVYALTLDYRQRHRVEIDAARNLARAFGVERHLVLDVDLGAIGGSSLTGPAEVPKGPRPVGADPIPPTYVPARNTVFLSLALALADAVGARDLYIGVSAVDSSGYPDCRSEFILAFEELANQGTRVAVHGGRRYRVHAPLLGMTKEDTVRAGLELGVDFSLTWSCYDPRPDGAPCRQCDACLLRHKGFSGSGVEDPVSGAGP